MKQLLLGCGNSRAKHMHAGQSEWSDLVTVDIDPDCGADIIHDLGTLPYPFDDAEFDEIHAYEVLEHVGTQGDWRFFFAQFSELHRILCGKGYVFISVPSLQSEWLWGDPGHTRALPLAAFSWLAQAHYEQVGKTACTDYRHAWRGNLVTQAHSDDGSSLRLVLQKVEA
jgi:hypothetical protein